MKSVADLNNQSKNLSLQRYMKIQTLLKLFLIVTTLAIIDAACSDCGRKPHGSKPLTVTNFEIEMLKANINPNTNKKSFYYQPAAITQNDSVKFNEIAFVLSPVIKYIAMIRKAGLFNMAFACDPVPSHSNQRFSSITITSTDNLITDDSTYMAGTDLSASTNVETYYQDPVTVEEFISSKAYIDPEKVYLVLSKAPSTPQQHHLTITVKLDDNSEFSLKATSPILLP
jgi:hypothetical protein